MGSFNGTRVSLRDDEDDGWWRRAVATAAQQCDVLNATELHT